MQSDVGAGAASSLHPPSPSHRSLLKVPSRQLGQWPRKRWPCLSWRNPHSTWRCRSIPSGRGGTAVKLLPQREEPLRLSGSLGALLESIGIFWRRGIFGIKCAARLLRSYYRSRRRR